MSQQVETAMGNMLKMILCCWRKMQRYCTSKEENLAGREGKVLESCFHCIGYDQ
ncbi:hypothetical protein MANES_03G064232v8 [Manihot esculenta]|uniref:Uncharacterized protein n=1 Tax=Manihot esculenta TaxID=3983 RepID=A0ACB7HXV6_MANES|nr:hypothetical protein MANES_03G064232v8 [Manihot esculenta]